MIHINIDTNDKSYLSKEIWLLIAAYSMGHASIHSFYPNMSKFLQ